MDEKQLGKFYGSITKHLQFLNDVDLNANGDDTIKLIAQTINRYAHSDFIKKCVKVIDSISKNEFEFCKNLFEISCALIKYRRDPPGHEIVMTPLLFIKVREGDCKKFTTWICSVLKCKGILCADKVVNYEKPFGWQHIYAIAWPKGYQSEKGYLVLDPVNKEQFNSEVSYRIGRVNFLDGSTSKEIPGDMAKLSIMGNSNEKNYTFLGMGEASNNVLNDLEEISGNRRRISLRDIQSNEDSYIYGVTDEILAGVDTDEMSGIGKVKLKAKVQAAVKKAKGSKIVKKATDSKIVQKAKDSKLVKTVQKQVEKRKQIFKGAKKVGFAPVRAAFIVLVHAGALLPKLSLGRIKFNLAQKLAEVWQEDNGASILKIWDQFGGKPDALKKAIVKSSKVQLAGIGCVSESFAGMGIGAAETSAIIIASITAAAPILVLVIKLLVDKNRIKKDEAARTASNVEETEDQNTDDAGRTLPQVNEAIKLGTKIIDEALKTDGGGDYNSQQTIKTFATNNDVQTPGSGTTPTYNTQGDPNNQGDPTPTPQAGGVQLGNASSWLNGALISPLLAYASHNEFLISAAPVVSTFLLGGAIILTIKSFLKNKYHG